jgi:hypothetical protein
VLSPTSYQTAPPRIVIITTPLRSVKPVIPNAGMTIERDSEVCLTLVIRVGEK